MDNSFKTSCFDCASDGVVYLDICETNNCDRISCISFLIDRPDKYQSFVLPNVVLNYDRVRDLLFKRYDRIDYSSKKNLKRIVELLKIAVTRRDFCFFNRLSNIVYWRLDDSDRMDIDLVRKIIN